MTEAFPSNNNEGVILNDAAQASHTNQLHQQQPLGQQLQQLQSGGHTLANRYNSNKTESTTTITTNIATTPASTTASLHGDNKSDVDDDDDDDDEEDEQGVESEPNCGMMIPSLPSLFLLIVRLLLSFQGEMFRGVNVIRIGITIRSA